MAIFTKPMRCLGDNLHVLIHLRQHHLQDLTEVMVGSQEWKCFHFVPLYDS